MVWADVMAPPLERSGYLYELRAVAENIVRERGEHSEVHPPGLSGGGPMELGEEQEPLPGSSDNLGMPIGPAFHIPMTQDKTLEELPSQIEFEWQDSVAPNLTPAQATTIAAAPTSTEDNAFVEVSEIAQEAVVHATQQQAQEHEAPQPLPEQQGTPEDAHPQATSDHVEDQGEVTRLEHVTIAS